MKVIILDNPNMVGQEAAEIILNLVKQKNNAVLGLATGSTPIPTYEQLISRSKEEKIDWSKITTFNLDEYLGLEPTNKKSYRYFMNENLFDHLNIDIKNTHVPDGLIDLKKDPSEYDQLIAKAGGIDLQLLGLGINGHIGFNEPGTSFDLLTSIVDLTESTIEANKRFFNSKNEVPTKAISMGLKSIMNAKQILLLATGDNKAEAIYQLVKGEITVDWPCSVLQKHNNVIIIVDNKAAKLLKD